MSEVAREELAALQAVAALSGPNLAPEIARGLPAATVIASRDAALAALAQELFMTPRFRPYTGTDIVGVEICGAVKNVIAIAAGICEGLGFGDNAKAALMTRAVAEIGRLVQALGGRAETVAGLSGIGDLIATCASPISRNHRVGLAVGRGEDYRSGAGRFRPGGGRRADHGSRGAAGTPARCRAADLRAGPRDLIRRPSGRGRHPRVDDARAPERIGRNSPSPPAPLPILGEGSRIARESLPSPRIGRGAGGEGADKLCSFSFINQNLGKT